MTKFRIKDARYYHSSRLEKHLFRLTCLDWIWTGGGEGRRGDVCRRKFSEVSVSIGLPARHSAASCQISKRSYSDRFGGRSKKRRAKNFLGKQGEGKSNSFRGEGRRKREGRRGNYFNSSRSIARCNFLAFTLGQGEGKKKGKKEGKSWSIRPDVLSRLLQRREWGGRGGHNLRENLCGVSLTPSSHV